MWKLNIQYTEASLGLLTDDIEAHLAAQVMKWSKYNGYKISVDPNDVVFDVFEPDEMNTVRKILTLLVVATSEFLDDDLLEKWVVELPEERYLNWVDFSRWWDLFEQVPYTAKSFCLTQAYQLLSNKLSQRNTPLFRILFICTCIELWRTKVPPELLLWPAWMEVHWWNVIYELTWRLSPRSLQNLSESWFPNFISVLKSSINTVSDDEVMNRKLTSEFNFSGSGINAHLVRDYLEAIMRESKKKSSQ
jgi:hypothetical protein